MSCPVSEKTNTLIALLQKAREFDAKHLPTCLASRCKVTVTHVYHVAREHGYRDRLLLKRSRWSNVKCCETLNVPAELVGDVNS